MPDAYCTSRCFTSDAIGARSIYREIKEDCTMCNYSLEQFQFGLRGGNGNTSVTSEVLKPEARGKNNVVQKSKN